MSAHKRVCAPRSVGSEHRRVSHAKMDGRVLLSLCVGVCVALPGLVAILALCLGRQVRAEARARFGDGKELSVHMDVPGRPDNAPVAAHER